MPQKILDKKSIAAVVGSRAGMPTNIPTSSSSKTTSTSSAAKTGAAAGLLPLVQAAAQVGAAAGASVVPSSQTPSGGYSGGSSGSSGGSYSTPSYGFSYSPYVESQDVINARNAMNAHNANRIADWTGGTYGEALKMAMDRILNREGFKFDLDGSALYEQYKNQNLFAGNLAMQDTMGQAAAMTGGYGSSYASTAGNQAYQGFIQKINDSIPMFQQMALDEYNAEGDRLYNQFGVVNDAYNNEYGEYRDKVNDWNAEAQRLSSLYFNLAGLDYDRYSDAYDRAFAENKYAQQMALQQAQAQAKAEEERKKAGIKSGQSEIKTFGDVGDFLQRKILDDDGKAFSNADKVKYLQDIGVNDEIIKEAKKYAFKDSQVKDRL